MREIGLDDVKKIEIEILNTLVTICEENHLRYFLTAGTLLGAVRHEGFIPWDDDIDVGMPRRDYEKLKLILHNRILDEKYQLLSYENHGTKYNFMKMVDVRTVLYEKYMAEATGVWVDIFPIDGLPNSYFLTRLKCIKLEFWRRILNISIARSECGKTKYRKLVKGFLQPIVKLISVNYMCRKINSVFAKYDFDSSNYVGEVSEGFSYKARIERKDYDEDVVMFEGRRYIAPKGKDKLLTQIYGDYMTLPPEDKRIQHEFKAYWKDE